MPTPVGHTLMGLTLWSGFREKGNRDWIKLLLILTAVNLPDLDYIPGLIADRPNAFHHGWTHSLLFAVFAGAVFAAVLIRKTSFGIQFLCMTGACLTHPVLDFFTKDTSAPFGEQLLWPFSQRYFLSSFSVFRDIYKGGTRLDFIQNLFHKHNLITMITELSIFFPLFLVVWFIRKTRNKENLWID